MIMLVIKKNLAPSHTTHTHGERGGREKVSKRERERLKQ